MPKPNSGEEKTEFLKRCTSESAAEGQSKEQAFAYCNRSWDNSQQLRAPLTLHVPVRMAKSDSGEPLNEFYITGYTGQIIDLGWWGRFIFDLAGMQFSQKMPVLREHARDRVVGYSLKAWVDGQNLLFKGKFTDKTQDGREVKDLADDDFPWQASIGIWADKVRILDSPKERAMVNGREVIGPLEIWTASKVKEVSFVALGADDQTAAIGLNLAELDKVPVSFERAEKPQEVAAMPMTLAQLEADAPVLVDEIRAAAHTGGVQEGRELGVSVERERILKILRADGDRELTLAAIEDGSTPETALGLFLQAEKERQAAELKKLRQEAPESMGQGQAAGQSGDFEAKVTEIMASGKTRAESVKLAAKQYPDLHREYLDRANRA